MARRIAGEGLVTVSLRRSMTGSASEVCFVSAESYIEILQYEFSDEFSRTIQPKQAPNREHQPVELSTNRRFIPQKSREHFIR